MKNKLIILSLILSSFSYGKSLSFDESLELYTGNNLSIKNIQYKVGKNHRRRESTS